MYTRLDIKLKPNQLCTQVKKIKIIISNALFKALFFILIPPQYVLINKLVFMFTGCFHFYIHKFLMIHNKSHILSFSSPSQNH